MTIFGVDVSKHQGPSLDWNKIKASGVDFMFARASLATTPDPVFATNLAGARAAGIGLLGAYHFLYPADVVSPKEQAGLFVDLIGDTNGLLTALDVERDRDKQKHVHEPKLSDITAFATEFARLTHNHVLLMYAPAWYWNGVLGNPMTSNLGPLHASHFVPFETEKVDGKEVPVLMTRDEAFAKVPKAWWNAKHGGWTKATILQFTSKGKIGSRGPFDMDAFQGSLDELSAFTGKA